MESGSYQFKLIYPINIGISLFLFKFHRVLGRDLAIFKSSLQLLGVLRLPLLLRLRLLPPIHGLLQIHGYLETYEHCVAKY